MVSPLTVIPEVKESKWCTEEGSAVLYDSEGAYLPAYPYSQVLGGRCSFEDFEEERVIGRGAFGQVFLATHKATGLKVAIKELTRPVEFRLIRREECIHHSLRSPLIVRHFCTISENDYIAFVMEYVEGTTLYKARRRSQNLPIVSIAAQLVLMLEFLHDRYILYRDFKPENIMYMPKTGEVKLIDFGLAHRLDGPNARTQGQSGTPPFMAPEIVESPTSRYSYPADWYALGLVIYELIRGMNPFDNIQDTGILYGIILGGFACNLADTNGCHLIINLTELDPSKRWGSTASTRRKIRRHPWFKGIPWEDFEAGRFRVRLPRHPRQISRLQNQTREGDNGPPKNPNRDTILAAAEPLSYHCPCSASSKIFPDSDGTIQPSAFGPDTVTVTTYDPVDYGGAGCSGSSIWNPPLKKRVQVPVDPELVSS